MTTKEIDIMISIFKAELPKNASKLIQQKLKNKGITYTVNYIRNQIYKKTKPYNIDIKEAAIELCDQEIDRKIALSARTTELKEKLIN